MKYFNVFVLFFAVFVLFVGIQGESPPAPELTAEEICRQPQIRGRCRALINRYFYNTTSAKCENFGYGGCGGNDNNFETQEACETKCNGITAA